jgi:hypothetical protein
MRRSLAGGGYSGKSGLGRRGRRTIHLSKHVVHLLDIVVVEEPALAVLVVLLKGNAKRVCDIYDFTIVLAEEGANDPFVGCAGDGAGVVVSDGEEDEGMDDDGGCGHVVL